MKRRIVLAAAFLAVAVTGTALATPGGGIAVTPLGAKTVGRVNIRETDPSTVSTVRVVLEPGGTTGWHSHPSSVFVAIETGEVTLFHSECTTRTLSAGGLFVERPGRVHNVENTGSVSAILIATFVGIPTGAEARIDQADPCA